MAGDCGTCTACCRVFAIPSLGKPAGKWCEHCAIGIGCRVYDGRPALCIDYKCLWLLSQGRDDPRQRLAPELRPDRCKVVFSPTTNDAIMAALTMPGSPDAWRKPIVRALIDKMTAADMAVAVGAPMAMTTLRITKYGIEEVQMTEPDENGMQWSINE
jgi:hypothetical protein